jgi:flavodoxin
MKTILLVYKSNTGFTKKYAQWIQEELNCTAVELKEIDVSEIVKYDIVIFGGGMHATRINGINFIKNNLELFKNRHLIIFATGATPASAAEEVKKFEQANIPNESNIPFFYFESGMNYRDMKINDKMVMNCLKFVLKIKKDKNSVDQGMMEAISNSYDNSKQVFIKPLIDYVRGLLA